MTVLTVKLVNGRELSRDTAGPVDAVHCHSLCGAVQRQTNSSTNSGVAMSVSAPRRTLTLVCLFSNKRSYIHASRDPGLAVQLGPTPVTVQ